MLTVFHVHWTILNHDVNLKVVFLFPSLMDLTLTLNTFLSRYPPRVSRFLSKYSLYFSCSAWIPLSSSSSLNFPLVLVFIWTFAWSEIVKFKETVHVISAILHLRSYMADSQWSSSKGPFTCLSNFIVN